MLPVQAALKLGEFNDTLMPSSNLNLQDAVNGYDQRIVTKWTMNHVKNVPKSDKLASVALARIARHEPIVRTCSLIIHEQARIQKIKRSKNAEKR